MFDLIGPHRWEEDRYNRAQWRQQDAGNPGQVSRMDKDKDEKPAAQVIVPPEKMKKRVRRAA